uniref:Regulator of chromosome condensation n=1 Tax=Parastrongyloides trichosuri TaxID=131310 RepID=A0A0N4ZWF0_PARTI
MKTYLYTLEDGTINEVEKNDENITSSYSHLGKVFIFNEVRNDIFYWRDESWMKIKLIKYSKNCGCHEINFMEEIVVKKLVISKDMGCCFDDSGRLWSFEISELNGNTIKCKYIELGFGRSVLDLVSGNDHFVALVGKKTNIGSFKIENEFKKSECDECFENKKNEEFEDNSKDSFLKEKVIERRESERIFSWKPFSSRRSLERHNTTEAVPLNHLNEINFDIPKVVERFSTLFSFVDLHNIIDKGICLEDSLSNSEDSVFKDDIKIINDNEIITEIFTWGNNEYGQLGCGDKFPRNLPVKINGFENQKIIKIVSGGDHSLALTASGQLYVWGSNLNGQLKQQNQEYFSTPFLFKVGYNNHIIDVDASQDCTALLIGNTTTDEKYMIISGCDHNTKQVNIKGLKEISGVLIEPGKGILLKSWLKTSKIGIVKNCIKYLSLIGDLTRITEFICENVKDKVEFINVIKNLKSKLKKLGINSGYIVGNLHKYLITGVDFEDNIVEDEMANDEFIKLLVDYHWSIINCYSCGLFTNLSLG